MVLKCQICVQNMGSVSYYAKYSTNPSNGSGVSAVLAPGRPNCSKKHTTVSQKDSTHREQNVWILLVTIIFSKPEDGREENQRLVCRARLRHPDSLQVLLNFLAGRSQYFGRLQSRLQIVGFGGSCSRGGGRYLIPKKIHGQILFSFLLCCYTKPSPLAPRRGAYFQHQGGIAKTRQFFFTVVFLMFGRC